MSSWNPSLHLRPIKHNMLREEYVCICEFPPRDFTAAQPGAINSVGVCFFSRGDQLKGDLSTGN